MYTGMSLYSNVVLFSHSTSLTQISPGGDRAGCNLLQYDHEDVSSLTNN